MSQIKTLDELHKVALSRRAVTIPGTGFKRTPAAFIMNLQGTVILSLLKSGMFIYKSKKKEEFKNGSNRTS